MDMETAERVAEILLNIGAVELRPSKPFRWASGILSPIYCDNRLLMSYVSERREVIELMAGIVGEKIGLESVEKVGGIASSGIPHAAWLAEKLGKPMIYVRKEEKGHGKENLIEGVLGEGDRVLLVEDLISTGGSSLNGVQAVRSKGASCDNCIAIFTYEMEKAKAGFEEAKCRLFTLTNFSTLVRTAVEKNFIKEGEMQAALEWAAEPQEWGRKMGFEA
jgi:orotate phosphoribosyltransferase